jgi:hypothetical protein
MNFWKCYIKNWDKNTNQMFLGFTILHQKTHFKWKSVIFMRFAIDQLFSTNFHQNFANVWPIVAENKLNNNIRQILVLPLWPNSIK